MEQVIEKIKRIEKSRAQLRQAIAENDIAIKPKYKDLSLIPQIFEKFVKDKDVITMNDRKEFIFAIVYLYAPCKFFGGKMPRGMRKAISDTMHIDSAYISRTCTELVVLYSTYRDFRQGVDNLLTSC